MVRTRGDTRGIGRQLGRLTPLPGRFWVVLFLLVCGGAPVLGGSRILDRPLR